MRYRLKEIIFKLLKLTIQWCILLFLICPLTAQNTTQINSNENVKPPVIKDLADMPAPKIKMAGTPKVTVLPENIAQGKAFFTTFDTDDGLSLDYILSGICDNNGNLWFGTGSGVSKYNGKSFTTYSIKHGLPNNLIRSIIEDTKGNFWFGTFGGGVSKYDGTSFTTYSTENGLVNDHVNIILEDTKGNIWFGTDNGLSKYDGTSFMSYTTKDGLAHNAIGSITEDKKGNLWFGTFGGGVGKYDGTSFTTYSVKHGLAHNYVFSIIEDTKGNLWFGTRSGINKYDGISFIKYTVEEGLAHNRVNSILEDTKGSLWFGTNGGVSEFDGEAFTTYREKHGLASNVINSITEDISGNLWFGTDGGGICKYNGKSVINYLTEDGQFPNNQIHAIFEDTRENLWFGKNGGGVSKYDGKSFVNYNSEQGLSDQIFSVFEDNKGNIWFGMSNGVSKFDGKTLTHYTSEQWFSQGYVTSIIEDKKGNLWFATLGEGVYKYDGKTSTNYTTEQGLANDYVISIIEDKKGNLWFATTSNGVSRLDTSIEQGSGINPFTNYNIEQGLANNCISSITEDKAGNLWFGTYGGGVNVLKDQQLKEKGKVKFLTINISNGLPDNGVTAVIEDKAGNIIIGANFGLTVIPLKTVNNIIKQEEPILGKLEGIEIYNQFSGYPIRDVNGGLNNGSLLCDNQGVIWIGTGSHTTGLVRFDYDAIRKDNMPSKVVIEKVSIKGKNICWYDLVETQQSEVDSSVVAQQEVITYGQVLSEIARNNIRQEFSKIKFDGITKFNSLPQNLVLPYKYNHITFDFAAIDTDRNFLINYQYKLEGQDSDWSPVTKKTDAVFNNLYEGDYTFLIKAQNAGGVWNEPVKYHFTVLAPWYRTWWSYTLYIIFLVGSITGIIKLQTRKVELRQKELQIKIRNATDEIRKQNIALKSKEKELAEKNETLAMKNEEKKVLINEIHHRVKNNLHVINSFLRLQSSGIQDKEVLEIFKSTQKRVISMSKLYEMMYKTDNITSINMKPFLSDLLKEIVANYNIDKNISIKTDIVNAELKINTLFTLGFIINEVVTNSFKYAFENKEEGIIELNISKSSEDSYEMIIGDNGIGVNKVEHKKLGLGTKLIEKFARQLQGTMELLDNKEGTYYKLVFTEHLK